MENGFEARIARIEEKLDRLKDQIDFGDRGVIHITRLIEESIKGQGIEIGKLQAHMARLEFQHIEDMGHLRSEWQRDSANLIEQHRALNQEITGYKKTIRGLLVGIGIGAALGGGSLGAIIVNAIKGG